MDQITLGEIVSVVTDPRSPSAAFELYPAQFLPTGKQLEVNRKHFGHMHVRGMTGSGKTSLSLSSLIWQFLRPYEHETTTHRDPILVIDLAGDANLFWNVREAAETYARRFAFLTLDPDLDSFLFPPFQAVPAGERNVIRISQMLISSFHLETGLTYGAAYFGQQNLAALLRVARKLVREGGNPSLEDMARYLDDPANRREFRDADQVRMTFDFLLEYPQLRSVGDPRREIDFAQALENSEVIYFYCPTLTEPVTARLVAGLGLYTALSACIQRTKLGKSRRSLRIFIDEFQEIVGRALAALLAQSRKFGVSLLLFNQSTSQLQNRDLSLADQIFEGTAIKQYFTSLGDDVDDLQSLSRVKSQLLCAKTSGGLGRSSISQREQLVPELERDVIRDVTYTFGRSFVVLNTGDGHVEPIVIQQSHTLPDYSNRPMPPRTDEFANSTKAHRSPPGRRIPLTDPDRVDRHSAVAELIRAKRAALEWSTEK